MFRSWSNDCSLQYSHTLKCQLRTRKYTYLIYIYIYIYIAPVLSKATICHNHSINVCSCIALYIRIHTVQVNFDALPGAFLFSNQSIHFIRFVHFWGTTILTRTHHFAELWFHTNKDSNQADACNWVKNYHFEHDNPLYKLFALGCIWGANWIIASCWVRHAPRVPH